MKKISIYRPASIEEAIQILSLHGTESGVYAGGTDLLIRLKYRLKQAPAYLVDIKKVSGLNYIREDAQGNVQIGRLFLGPSWAIATGAGNRGGQEWGWSIARVDPSMRGRSKGGQTRINELPQMRVLQFTLDFQSEAQMFDNAFEMARANGVVRDVVAIPDIQSSYVSEQAVFGLLRELQPIVNRAFGIYMTRFEIEERL